ncbi:hypothetical protein ACQ4PT_046686 [Festuca glaucescens]
MALVAELENEYTAHAFVLYSRAGRDVKLLVVTFSGMPVFDWRDGAPNCTRRGTWCCASGARTSSTHVDPRCEEELVGETASAEMLQEHDVSLNTATLDGLSFTATSSSSVQEDAVAQDSIQASPPPCRCLSSSPIWVLNRLMDQPGVSPVDEVVRQCLYWPDGTRKKRLEPQPIAEKRDYMRQLIQALVDKYKEHNHLLGDAAYEVKDVVRFRTVQGASDHSRMHYHINFTIKTKGADGSTCVIDDLFFAEVTFKPGHAELVVSCFCTVKPTDNGCCHDCDVKHPNDAAAYTGGQVSPLGEYGDIMWTGYNETETVRPNIGMPRNDEVPPETNQQVGRSAPPVSTSRGAGGRHPPNPSPRHRVLHFYVPIIEGREIISVDSREVLAASRSDLDDGPVIFVDIDMDGNLFTEGYCVPGEPFESMDQLIHAAGVHLLTGSCRDQPQCKEGGLVAEPACGQKLKQHDLSSVKDLLNATTLEELSTTATSSVQMQTQPWRCLSSSPIWPLPRLDWGITFYIRIDLNESYHTYPDVGGPFQSLQAAHNAIDRYLQGHQDPTMFTQQPGVSRLDMVARQCLNWPDGTRKKLLESQIDERRDWKRQLVQDLVDKYNDYRHLMGDRAYKLKDVVLYNSVSGGNDHSRLYDHINFTMKGAEDSNCGIDDLFFAEVTFKRGEYSELMVSCFCMVKPTDNGLCYGCDVKHPNDAAAYTGAGVNSQRACPIFGNMKWKCRNETLQEEEDRVRNLYKSQGLDAPDYLERVKEEMTLKPFRPKYLDVETMDED